MNKTTQELKEIKLVGISARTSNALEMNPETAQIGAVMQRFFGQGMQSFIPSRKKPGTVFAVYTDYESDANGQYTYFLGEEVESFDGISLDAPEMACLKTMTIPVQSYAKFTSEAGPMPSVCIDMWQKIWKMDESGFGGQRSYVADFEVYDERSRDLQSAVLDIYVGIQK